MAAPHGSKTQALASIHMGKRQLAQQGPVAGLGASFACYAAWAGVVAFFTNRAASRLAL